jgi:O-antigen biosynthesis protein WbqP
VGAILRRTKFDELPQILNILRNEMSLVGPRPCLAAQETLIAERLQRGVLNLKPGITGLAQINDIDMSDPRYLAIWDARYGASRTLLLDVVILVRTILGKGSGDRIAPQLPFGDGPREQERRS